MPLAMDQLDGTIWLNGEFIPWQDAKLHVISHGLHYASSVFEGARAYNGKVFKLREHSERLIRSAKLLDCEISYNVADLNAAIIELLRQNNLTNAYVRPIAWRGSDYMGVASYKCKVNTAIATWEWPSYYKEEALTQGINLCLVDWARPDPKTAPVQAKAACLYAIGSLSKNQAEKTGYDDAFMLDWRGYVAECTSSNIFFVFNGELHTPIPDCFLNGITRQTVMQLAQDMGVKVVERYIKYEEIAKADEVFVTGTAAEVTPVGKIAEYKYTVGEMTKKLRAAYLDLTQK